MRCPWSSTRSPLVKLLMSGWCVQARPVTVFHDNAWWFQVLNSVYTIIHPPTQTTTTTVILVEMKWLCITAGASREHDALFFIVVDRCRGLRHLYIYMYWLSVLNHPHAVPFHGWEISCCDQKCSGKLTKVSHKMHVNLGSGHDNDLCNQTETTNIWSPFDTIMWIYNI